MRPVLLFLPVITSLILMASNVWAQTFGIQYGLRAFWTAPVGTHAVNIKYEELRAFQDINGRILQGFEIGSTSVIASYTTYFDFFGQSASVPGALAPVSLEGDLDTTLGTIPILEEEGVSDPYFQFYTTLIVGQTMTLKGFATTEPGFVPCACRGWRLAPAGHRLDHRRACLQVQREILALQHDLFRRDDGSGRTHHAYYFPEHCSL